MFDLLTHPLIRVRLADGEHRILSLPDVYAVMMQDQVAAFSALRPHQRHAWHAFLAQLGAIALHRAGRTDPPDDPESWRELIEALTPEWPNHEPWQLVVEDITKPGFLQPSVPEGSLTGFGTVIATADKLDVLETSKNHDLKATILANSKPDDWLFSLVNLQTMAGYGGRIPTLNLQYYGIVRMRGSGFSRIQVGLSRSPSVCRHLRHDILSMLRLRDQIIRSYEDYAPENGVALTWTVPWDGTDAVSLTVLDPFFIEICRRIRLVAVGSALTAVTTGTKSPRINAKALNGNTGDFWTPVDSSGTEPSALGLRQGGFGYRMLVRVLFNANVKLPPAMDVSGQDGQNLWLIARGVARWSKGGVKSTTAGYHERIIPCSRRVAIFFKSKSGLDLLGETCKTQIADVGAVSDAFRYAMRFFVLDGVDEDEAWKPRNREKVDRAAKPWLARLDAEVDGFFFPELWRRVEAIEAGGDAVAAAQRAFRSHVVNIARSLLAEAAETVSCPAIRRPRARARAFRTFNGLIHHHFPDLRPSGPEILAHDDAA